MRFLRFVMFLMPLKFAVPVAGLGLGFLVGSACPPLQLMAQESDDESPFWLDSVAAPPFELEDPGGASIIISYGQSPTQGVCSVQASDLFTSCGPISSLDLPGARMACYDNNTDTYSGTVPLNLADGTCRRGLAELPMYGMAEIYLQESGLTTVFTCNTGQQGTSIPELSDPSVHFDRLRNCVQAIRDDVTVNYLAYGLTSPLSYLRGLKIMQCESDDINRSDTYTADVLAFMDDLEAAVAIDLPHQTQVPQVVWYQCANTLATVETLGITQSQLVVAAGQRSNLHLGGQFGHINQNLCNVGGEACQMETFASTLHYSPPAYRHMAYKLGLELYRAVYRLNPGAITLSSIVANGTDVQACFNVRNPPLVLDTTICPPHWNGNDGFRFVNAAGPLFNDTRFISEPQIVSTTLNVNGTCIDFELDREPYEGITFLSVGNEGLVRSSNEPSHGCRNLAGTVNTGARWTGYTDSDTTTAPDTDYGTMVSWMAMDTAPVSGGLPPPADTGPGFVTLEPTEWMETPDLTPDVFDGSQRNTFLFWIDTNGSADGDLIRKGNPNVDGFRLFFDNNPGSGSRIQFAGGGIGNSSTPPGFDLAEDEATSRFYAIVHDGTLSLGDRVKHYIGDLDQDGCSNLSANVAGTIPTSLSDTTDAFRVGFNGGTTPSVQLREFAVWTGVAASEFQIFEACRRGYVDLRNTTMGAPDYYVRPSCDDSATAANGFENLGSQAADFTGNNMEAGDITLDNAPVCAGGFDGGVVEDAGTPPDAGGGPDPTVPNVASLRFDGVDDYITITDTDLLDLETDALICMVVRPLTNRVNDTIAGHWSTTQFQWRWWARNAGARYYVPSLLTSANSYLARESTPGWPYLHVSGSHQLLCMRYDLSQAAVEDRIRAFRNAGEPITLDTNDVGPATDFNDVTGGSITIGCTGTGTECWAGDVDELAVWVGANVPTDLQIQNDVMFDANDWDCVVPNWNGGVVGVSAPDIWYRFEQDLTDELGGPTGSIGGGAPIFATDTVACDGTYANLSSLAPNGVNQSWSTNIMISTESADVSMVASVTFDTVTTETGWIVGQWQNPGAGENSWGIQQITDDFRVFVSTGVNDVSTFVDFTGPGNIQAVGWNNAVVKFDLTQAVQADRVRLWLNGTEMTTKAVTGTLPDNFVRVIGSETRLGETLGGALDWGANVEVTNLVLWRDQDTEPTVAEIEATFAVNSNAGDPLPDYGDESPLPGCWFTLMGGDFSDRLGSCQDFVPNGGSVWNSVPNAPAPTP